MGAKYTKTNGWFKFFTEEGLTCRIKSDEVNDTKVIIKYRHENDIEWTWHSPNIVFKNQLEVARYLLKNLETDQLLFRVKAARSQLEV